MSRLAELHPKRFFLDTWRQLDQESAELRKDGNKAFDWEPMFILVFGGLMLIFMEYWGNPAMMRNFIQPSFVFGNSWASFDLVSDIEWFDLRRSSNWELYRNIWWAVWRVLGFFVLPAIAIKFRKQKVRDFGLETKGFLEHLWIYGLCLGVVLVCVVVVSYDEHFQTYYPFYRNSSRSWLDFISWELLYAAQFFSLEFFFRGWFLQGMKRSMGSQAIFVMMLPYVMIHFGKPMIETVGAIVAGVVLGTLAMKTRSIWSGFLIHVSVAISMDLASMVQRDALPTIFSP